jgi:hypothetical protein
MPLNCIDLNLENIGAARKGFGDETWEVEIADLMKNSSLLYQFSLKLNHKGFPRSPNADSLCRTMEVRDGSAGGCFAERF